jgi:hypothetical protein
MTEKSRIARVGEASRFAFSVGAESGKGNQKAKRNAAYALKLHPDRFQIFVPGKIGRH